MLMTVTDENNNQVTIKTVEDPDSTSKIEYSGDHQMIADIKSKINENPYGYYGHIIDPDVTTSLDLYVAIMRLEGYKIEVDKVPRGKPIPDGCVS